MNLAFKAAPLARHLLFAGSILATGGLAVSAAAQAATDEAAIRFGVRESVMDISLSPSGNKIAYISAGPQHTEIVNVIDFTVDAPARQIAANTELSADLDWCEWANDQQLVCQASGMAVRPDGVLLPFDRLFSIDVQTGASKELSKRQTAAAVRVAQGGGDVLALDVGGQSGRILISSEAVPESDVRTRMVSKAEGLGVEIVDVATGKRSALERYDPLGRHYIADTVGKVRMKVRNRMSSGRLTG